MSEERIIRINKVLRELNISLERAVDYLKDKGIAIESNPNTKISEQEFNILQSQFAGDKGNKEASKEVGEEKRKEKEALRIEREKEVEDKRKLEEDRLKQQEVIKARATLSGPVQVGKIDLNPKKAAPAPEPVAEKVIESKDGSKVIAEAIRASEDQIASSSEVFRLLNKIYTTVNEHNHMVHQQRACDLIGDIMWKLELIYLEELKK